MTRNSFKESKQDIYCSRDKLFDKTHFLCNSIGSVGNIAFIINHLYFQDGKCGDIYIDFTKRAKSGWNSNVNPYDLVFDQKIDDYYKPVLCYGYALTEYDDFILNDIRSVVKPFFKFNIKFLNDAYRYRMDSVNENTLGVHIRLHDMNSWHGDQYGYVYYEDYVKYIDMVLGNNPITKIFVASDNHESLRKLIKRYGDLVVFAGGVARRYEEQIDGTEPELREKSYITITGYYNFLTPFIDMLILAKCGYLIGRKYSNFFHTSVMLGDAKYENIFEL